MLKLAAKALDFVFDIPLGKLAAGGAALLVMIGLFAADQQRRGGARVVAKVEKNNADVARKADAAARKSRDPGAAGVRNPYYRRDD